MILLGRWVRPGVLLRTLLLGALWWLFGSAVAAAAQPSPQQTERQLKQLQGDIGALQKKLRSTQGEYKQLTRTLRKTEQEGGRLSRQLADNTHQIAQQKQQIEALSGERSQLQQRRDAQLQALSAEVSAAYRTGQQDRLRLLLNQQQPEQVSRMLRYYRYLSDARSAAVNEVEQTLAGLDRVEQQLQQQRQLLATELQTLQTRSEALQQSRQQRQQALAAIKRQVRSQSQSLAQLKADQKRLERVFKELQQPQGLNELQVATQAFAKLKGKLPWPTAAKRVALRFGSDSAQGVRRNGMLIRAHMGATVKAVHNGRVVFSDWMRGYGMLLILDHGGGYMTLYGHNQSLLKQVGDWVPAGVPIASAGDSGGQSRVGLYFAIRNKGKPINPQAWLKRG
ncbi:MAG: peptidoglycan DD-metalloendopeptidase family protein [Motiliproteus sp.]